MNRPESVGTAAGASGGSGRRRLAAAAWLAAGCLLPLMLLLGHAVRARNVALPAFEYREWVDGQVYSMASWRYWEDMKFGIGGYLDGRYGAQQGRRARMERAALGERPVAQTDLTDAYREVLWDQTSRAGIRPYQFWRTLPDRPFLGRRKPFLVPPLEDPGRGIVAGWTFRVLGGISPYALVWLGPLSFVPCALWCWYEWTRAGRRLGASVFLGALALSPYVVETLTLPHSAVGFYLVAVIVTLSLGVYATRPGLSRRGYFVRAGLAGCVLALCTYCRSGSLVVFPACAASLSFAACSAFGGTLRRPSRRAAMAAAAACVLLAAPYLAIRPTQQHAFWISLWEGLADFGVERGYSWHDRDAKRLLERAGIAPFTHPNEVTAEQELFFKRLFLRDVGEHPAWFVGVLAKRAVWTLTQAKLLPWKPLQGRSVVEPIYHYKYVTPADFFGWPGRYVELPLPLLWLPVLALGVLAFRGPPASPARGDLGVLAVTLLATLPLPVAVSTAAGIETQALAIGYLAAFGMVVDRAWGLARRTPPR